MDCEIPVNNISKDTPMTFLTNRISFHLSPFSVLRPSLSNVFDFGPERGKTRSHRKDITPRVDILNLDET